MRSAVGHSCSRLLSPPFHQTFDQLPQVNLNLVKRERREETPELSPGVEEPCVGLCLGAGAGASAQCLSFGSVFPLSKCHCLVAVKVFALVIICLRFVICAYGGKHHTLTHTEHTHTHAQAHSTHPHTDSHTHRDTDIHTHTHRHRDTHAHPLPHDQKHRAGGAQCLAGPALPAPFA